MDDEINERMKQEEQQQSLQPKTRTTILTTMNENLQNLSLKNPSAIEEAVSSPKVDEEEVTTSTVSVVNTSEAIYDEINQKIEPPAPKVETEVLSIPIPK